MSQLIFGLPAATVYPFCMEWLMLRDYARLEVALGSATKLSNTLQTVGELHSPSTIETYQCLKWAVIRKISTSGLNLWFFSLEGLTQYLAVTRSKLLSIRLLLGHNQRRKSDGINDFPVENCPNLEKLDLRGHRVGPSLYLAMQTCPLRYLSLALDDLYCPGVARCATLQTLILSDYNVVCNEEKEEPGFLSLRHLEIRDRPVPNRALRALVAGGNVRSLFLLGLTHTAEALETTSRLDAPAHTLVVRYL
jgi:hypothetical protein